MIFLLLLRENEISSRVSASDEVEILIKVLKMKPL